MTQRPWPQQKRWEISMWDGASRGSQGKSRDLEGHTDGVAEGVFLGVQNPSRA